MRAISSLFHKLGYVQRSGHYPIERRAGEIERLLTQAAAIEFDAGVMLDRVGVAAGWRCLDLGCGPVGIVELLSLRAGPSGRVVGDAYRTGLPRGSFDLVHARFLASTAGQPEALIAEAMALARPGAIVALQEPDISTLKCYPPHPAWDRLVRLCEQVFGLAGGDVSLAQRLYQLARHAGLEAVRYRPFLVGFSSGDPMTDYLPATVESLRGMIVGHRLIDERDLDATLAACRSHLADVDTVFTYPTVAQVWGRCPAGRR
jgi:hypothetical protein